MYGKIPERKLKESDYVLSCEEARRQLDEYMDSENRRVNIDSAKKLAVVQHMDYEGFRQMVLGANIFPAKSVELSQIIKGQENKIIHNKLFDEKKSQEHLKEIRKRVEGNSEQHCLNFRDFKKKFNKNYDKQLTWDKAEECYALIKQQNQSRLEKIFNLQCEADILVKVVEIFRFTIDFLIKGQRAQQCRIECGFMVKFLQIVLSLPTMQDISLNILTKKQREKIVLFLSECKMTLNGEQEIAAIGKVITLIRKQ